MDCKCELETAPVTASLQIDWRFCMNFPFNNSIVMRNCPFLLATFLLNYIVDVEYLIYSVYHERESLTGQYRKLRVNFWRREKSWSY